MNDAADETDNIERIAWHEAGHAVAHVLTGVPFAVATIVPRDGITAQVAFADWGRDLTNREIDRHVFCLLAGRQGELLFDPDSDISSCRADDAQADEMAAVLHPDDPGGYLWRKRLNVATWAASPDVQAAIGRIAASLLLFGKLHFREAQIIVLNQRGGE